MNIAIDAINVRSDGGKTHLLEIIKYFELSNSSNKKVFLFCDTDIKKLAKKFNNIETIDLPQITNFWLFGIIWQTFFLSKLVKKKDCSVLFNLNGTYIGNFKNVVTITQNLLPFNLHEASKYGFSFKFFKFFFYKIAHIACLNKSKGIIFLSNYQKQLLSKYIYKNKLTKKNCLIPHAGKIFKYNKEPKDIKNYNISNPFVIGYVSSIEPYKNHIKILDYLYEIKKKGYPIKYLIVGKKGHSSTVANLVNKINELDPKKKWIEWRKNVDYEIMSEVYSRLDMMIFGSTCESFGIPVAEAIQTGIPTLCADKECLRSSFNEKVLYFNPLNKFEALETIENIILSKNIRKIQRRDYVKTYNQWNWEKVSKETFHFLEKFNN